MMMPKPFLPTNKDIRKTLCESGLWTDAAHTPVWQDSATGYDAQLDFHYGNQHESARQVTRHSLSGRRSRRVSSRHPRSSRN